MVATRDWLRSRVIPRAEPGHLPQVSHQAGARDSPPGSAVDTEEAMVASQSPFLLLWRLPLKEKEWGHKRTAVSPLLWGSIQKRHHMTHVTMMPCPHCPKFWGNMLLQPLVFPTALWQGHQGRQITHLLLGQKAKKTPLALQHCWWSRSYMLWTPSLPPSLPRD